MQKPKPIVASSEWNRYTWKTLLSSLRNLRIECINIDSPQNPLLLIPINLSQSFWEKFRTRSKIFVYINLPRTQINPKGKLNQNLIQLFKALYINSHLKVYNLFKTVWSKIVCPLSSPYSSLRSPWGIISPIIIYLLLIPIRLFGYGGKCDETWGGIV